MTERLAAVVISHDSERDLSVCLEALLDERSLATVVVVDNRSRDGSLAVLEAIRDPRLEVLELDSNTGFAGGCNRGYKALAEDVDLVTVLNPDVVVEPGCLARCAGLLAARPEIGAVAPLLVRRDRVTVDSVGQVLAPWTLEVRDRGYGQPISESLLEPRQVLAACGALGVFRRAALAEVADEHGPWAERFFCFWEDLELGWRLTNRGWQVVTAPTAVAVHGRGAGARQGHGPLRWRRQPELEACVVTNRWMTLIRHLHPRDAARRLPLLLLWDVGLLALSVARRPVLAGHLRRRWPLVSEEWRGREQVPRKRLTELPC